MPYSMTGYAQAEAASDEAALEVGLRSVNHRFLDLRVRLPRELEACEPLVRRLVKAAVRRGQVQINVELRRQPQTVAGLNRELAAAYLAAFEELAKELDSAASPHPSAMLAIPGMLAGQAEELSPERKAELESLLEAAVAEALEKLNQERAREGAGLAEDLRQRARRIRDEVDAVAKLVGGMTERLQARLQQRMQELIGSAGVEPQRIAQEAAMLADKADVSEELQRLRAHAERLPELLESDDEVGKKIDFIGQEMNREANTLLSKTTPLGEAGLELTEAGLRLKSEIEKIREQAQNLE